MLTSVWFSPFFCLPLEFVCYVTVFLLHKKYALVIIPVYVSYHEDFLPWPRQFVFVCLVKSQLMVLHACYPFVMFFWILTSICYVQHFRSMSIYCVPFIKTISQVRTGLSLPMCKIKNAICYSFLLITYIAISLSQHFSANRKFRSVQLGLMFAWFYPRRLAWDLNFLENWALHFLFFLFGSYLSLCCESLSTMSWTMLRYKCS
jgi:hypothetical protein